MNCLILIWPQNLSIISSIERGDLWTFTFTSSYSGTEKSVCKKSEKWHFKQCWRYVSLSGKVLFYGYTNLPENVFFYITWQQKDTKICKNFSIKMVLLYESMLCQIWHDQERIVIQLQMYKTLYISWKNMRNDLLSHFRDVCRNLKKFWNYLRVILKFRYLENLLLLLEKATKRLETLRVQRSIQSGVIIVLIFRRWNPKAICATYVMKISWNFQNYQAVLSKNKPK